MFYETERIIRKNQRYVLSKAYGIISSLESKNLKQKEVIACLDVMLSEDNTETKVDILNLAREIVTSKNKESRDEEVNPAVSNDDVVELQCF